MSRGSILVVDDTAANRYAVRRILESAGYDVTEAPSPAEALRMAATGTWDLITLDVQMPEMLGFEVAARLRASAETALIPLLHVSASHVDADARIRGLEGGADGYLTFPLEPGVLIATVNALIRARHAERERRIVERERERLGLLLSATLRQMPSGVVVLEAPSGRLTMSNDRARELLGEESLRVGAIVDERDLGAVHLDGRRYRPDEYPGLLALERDEPVTEETRYRRPNGDVVVIDVAAAPVRDEHGVTHSIVVVLNDVTDRRAALEVERAGRELAERELRFSDLFVGILGHDLRNPLGAITTTAQLIITTVEDPRARQLATRLQSSSQRMARMIDQLLDFTRLRLGGGLQLDVGRTDVAALARATCDELEAAVPGAALALETTGDPVGAWDDDRLLQALSNLVANALHHGTPGGRVAVRVDGSRSDRVTISVHNDGEIPSQVMPTLFDPFRGGDRGRTTRSGGLGLGLYITRAIVEAHDGDVLVSSSAAAGTTFEIVLPRGITGTRSAGRATQIRTAPR